jgi:hypothetical protein
VPFILDELSLPFSKNNDENIDTFIKKILEVSEKYSPSLIPDPSPFEGEGRLSDWKQLSYKAKWIAEKYTSERWMEQVREFLHDKTKKILLVTDYMTTLG